VIFYAKHTAEARCNSQVFVSLPPCLKKRHLLAFTCIVYMSNAPKAPDGGSYNGSGLLAITGLLWFAAEYILIRALISKKR